MSGKEKKSKPYITWRSVKIEFAAWVFLLASLVLTAISLPNMPSVVPTHFDLAGNPDGWGSPNAFLLYPVILLFVFACTSGCIHFLDPAYWNTPGKITEEDRVQWYRDCTMVMVLTELIVAVHALVLQHCMVNGLQSFVTLSVGALVVALTVLYVWMLFKMKREY